MSKVKVKYPALRKEAAFSYENEYRFIIRPKNQYSAEGYNFYLGKPEEIKFSILVNPLLEMDDFEAGLEWVEKSGFKKKWKLSPVTKWLKPEVWEILNDVKKEGAKLEI